MSVGDAHELRAAIAGPAHDVSGTAHSEYESGIGEGSRVQVDGLQGENTRIDHGDSKNYCF